MDPILKDLRLLMIVYTGFLWGCSHLRHVLFQSSAFDLGIFDQALYLIAQGSEPFCSLIGFHILGDHAALILYPLALFYKIIPSVEWLFLIQAGALVSGSGWVFILARQQNVSRSLAFIISGIYLFHPLVFNSNLFDFHPEVIAIPACFAALWAARSHQKYKLIYFIVSILILLSCKAVLSLTVLALGGYLMIRERAFYKGGILAITLGSVWFLITTQVVIPFFKGGEHAAISRYDYLGGSIPEIIMTLIQTPKFLLSSIASTDAVFYLLLLVLPFAPFLSFKALPELIPILPTLLLNLLSETSTQRDLIHHYSLPTLPFFMAMVIYTLTQRVEWFTSGNVQIFKLRIQVNKFIIIWSMLCFLILAKYSFLASYYSKSVSFLDPLHQSITIPESQASILTTNRIAPHLSQRSRIELVVPEHFGSRLFYDYILLNTQEESSWHISTEDVQVFTDQLQHADQYDLIYQNGSVYLFQKNTHA